MALAVGSLATGSAHASPGISTQAAGGYVIGWGYNEDGQAKPPPGLSGVKAIAAGGGAQPGAD